MFCQFKYFSYLCITIKNNNLKIKTIMWRNSYAYYEKDGKYYDIFTDEYVGKDSSSEENNK